MPLWTTYDPNLPHCVVYERGRGDTQTALKLLINLIEKVRIASGWAVSDVHPRALAEHPLLRDLFDTAWKAQLDLYGQKGTSVNVVGNATTQHVWQHYQWVQHGRRVYDVGENLARALLDTEMRVSLADIPVPLPSYYVRVPASLGLTVGHGATGEHVLDGFYVSHKTTITEYDDKRALNTLSIIAVGRPHVDGRGVGDDALACYGVPGNVTNVEEFLIEEETQAHTQIGLADNASRMAPWARLVLGLALYLTSEGVDVEKRRLGPTDALRAKAKKIGGNKGKRMIEDATLPVHYVRVGFREKMDADLTAHNNADEATRALTKRFVVRGHYRNQAHGPERSERKLIYIRPHWKGPPWAEVTGARVHKVE